MSHEELDMNSASLKAAKTQLRAEMKQRLASLPKDSIISQSNRVFQTLRNFPPYVNARTVAVYLAMPEGEIQTNSIVRHALSSGKQVFVPYLHSSGLSAGDGPARLMDMVSLADISDYESLKRDKWGIPSINPSTITSRQRGVGEPSGERQEYVALDLILLPGVAFDKDPKSGVVRRLGHGKGFYDYFLHRYGLAALEAAKSTNGRPSALLYALALQEQFLSPTSDQSVPVGPHDQPIDGVFLGSGEIEESVDQST